MNPVWRTALWQQYGAAIDMLDNAIIACPDDVWNDPSRQPQSQFWYIAFHTLFFLDFYLSETEDGFAPPAPFTLDELDPAGVYPERALHQGGAPPIPRARPSQVPRDDRGDDGRATRRAIVTTVGWTSTTRICCSTTCATSSITPDSSISFCASEPTRRRAWVRFARSEEPSPTPSAR